ncbi:hypothetical protein J3A83DRAFT_4189806 [Scleroderma citrinum]
MILNWVRFDHVAGLIKMHMTPLLCSASQLHIHPSAILADPLHYLCLIEEKSIDTAFAPNFLLSKLTHDLEKCSELFGTFSLSSLKQINSRHEVVVTKTAQAFSTTLKNLSNNPNWSFVISARFGMTETCTGCICNPIDVLVTPPTHEFLELGTPISGCEMCIIDPTNGLTLHPDSESSELQVHRLMIFICYYNNTEATSSSFVEGSWYPRQCGTRRFD